MQSSFSLQSWDFLYNFSYNSIENIDGMWVIAPFLYNVLYNS